MAKQPSLESRLQQLLPEVAPSDVPPDPMQEAADFGDTDAVQVAGALTDLFTKGAKLIKEGQASKSAKAAEAEAATLEKEASVIAKPPVKPIIPVQETLPPTGAGAGRGKVSPAPVQPDVADLQKQMGVIEQTIEKAPTSGVPPETMINLNRIDGPDDFKQMVETLVTSSGITTQRMTWEQTIAMAKQKGFGSDLIGDLQAMQTQYKDIPVDVVRLRLAGYKNAQEFYAAAKKSYLNPDDKELQAQLLYRLSLQNAINETYVMAKTRSAQGTAAGGIQITEGKAAGILDDANVKLPSVSDAEMKAMLDDPNVDAGLKQLIEKFVQLQDDGAREGLLNKASKVGLVKDLWDRTWKFGLLSSSGTHIVNLASNTTFLASSVATRALAGLVGTAKRSVGLAGEVELGEANAMVAGIISAFREGMGLGWTALKTGTTREQRMGTDLLSDAGQKLEGQYNAFDARDYGFENENFVKGVNAWATFVTLLGGRPIMATDEVFKLMGYRAELYAQAYRSNNQAKRAAIEAGASADEAELQGLSAMAQILSDPPKQIDEAATDFSQMITFSRKLTGAAAKVQEMAQDHLIGRITLPFVKTPVWVASESLQHSALAPLSAQWRADFAAGGAKRELAMAKFGMGSMLMMGVGSYVADGRMTGGGPGDTNLRNIYLASGWRPYSFVIQPGEWDAEFVDYLKGVKIDPSVGKDGKLYVPFRGIDPIAGPLAMIADTVEYARYEDDQDAVGQWVLGAVWGLYNYVGQQPFLTAMSSITGAFAQNVPNPKAAFRNAIDALVSTGVQYAVEGSPVGVFNSARAAINRGLDNTKRLTKESPELPTGLKGFFEGLNKVQDKTPFLSNSLPEQYDYLGEVMTDVDPANPWLASTSGIRFSYAKQRPADKIMIQLQMSIKKPDMNISAGGVTVKLEPEEYTYMMKQLGQVTDGNGDRLKDAIVSYSDSYGFQTADKDEQQESMKRLYAGFVKMAHNELLTNSQYSETIQRRIEAAIERRPRVGIYEK